MQTLPDHPDIANALRTGYPHGDNSPEIICDDCGEYLTSTERVYIIDNAPLCRRCALNYIEANFDVEEIADKLGITSKTVWDYKEELNEQ